MKFRVYGAALDQIVGGEASEIRFRIHRRQTNELLASRVIPGGQQLDVRFDELNPSDWPLTILVLDARIGDVWSSRVLSMHYRLFERITRFPDPLRPESQHIYTSENLNFVSVVEDLSRLRDCRVRYQKALRSLLSLGVEPAEGRWTGWASTLPRSGGTELGDMLLVLAMFAGWAARWVSQNPSFAPRDYSSDASAIREDFLRENRDSFERVLASDPQGVAATLMKGCAATGLAQHSTASEHFVQAWRMDSDRCRALALAKRRPFLYNPAQPTAHSRNPFPSWQRRILYPLGTAPAYSTTVLISGDPTFLRVYLHRTATQIAALRGLSWHFHVIADEAETLALRTALEDVIRGIEVVTNSSDLLARIRVTFSCETLAEGVDRLAFFASARFLRSAELLDLLGTDLWIIDADAFFQADPVSLLEGSLRTSPVTLVAGPVLETLLPWSSIPAWSVYLRSEDSAKAAAKRLAEIAWAYLQEGGTWMLDQVALNQLYNESKLHSPGTISLNRLAGEALINFHSSLAARYEAISRS